MKAGKLNPVGSAKINFPGFQEILDFTSAGSEASVSVAVDGDVDKEYFIHVRGFQTLTLNLNSDTGNNYGRQYILNNAGTITAARATTQAFMDLTTLENGSVSEFRLLTPSGFIKTAFLETSGWSSGTTIARYFTYGFSYNSTSNVTAITMQPSSGNFTSGTRITVYVRRSQS